MQVQANKGKFHWPKNVAVKKTATNQTMPMSLAYFIG